MIPVTITDVRPLPGDSGFLIDDGKTAILCDSGFAFTGFALLENIRRVLGQRQLDYILLTHSHYDHVLGVPAVLTAYPEAKVVAGSYAAAVFRKESARATMARLNEKAAMAQGMPPLSHLTEGLRVDIALSDGDEICCGDMRFTAVALPGHTKCSVGYYLKENRLLIGTETLSVYCGEGRCLPSFLVGYRMTLDSFQKARALAPDAMLLPHYGVIEGETVAEYLTQGEAVTRSTWQAVTDMLRQGKTREQMLEFFTLRDYREDVRAAYPVDAFLLNTGIMIDRIQKEALENPDGSAT